MPVHRIGFLIAIQFTIFKRKRKEQPGNFF